MFLGVAFLAVRLQSTLRACHSGVCTQGLVHTLVKHQIHHNKSFTTKFTKFAKFVQHPARLGPTKAKSVGLRAVGRMSRTALALELIETLCMDEPLTKT